jgi:hypothetical protein
MITAGNLGLKEKCASFAQQSAAILSVRAQNISAVMPGRRHK